MQEVIENIVTPNFMKMLWDASIQNNPFMSIMAAKGSLKTVSGGEDLRWPVKGGHFNVFNSQNYGDAADQNVPQQRFFRPVIAPGKKSIITPLSIDDLQQATSEYTQVQLEDEMIPSMFDDLLIGSDNSVAYDALNANVTGVPRPLYGLGTINNFTTSATKAGTVPSTASYAGYSMEEGVVGALMNQGEDDAWTPKAADSTASVWGSTASSGFTLNTCYGILNYLQQEVTYSARNIKERPDCGILTKEHFGVYRDYLTSITGFRYEGSPGATDQKWGIGASTEELPFGGMNLFWDSDAPSSMILNMDRLFLNGWKANKDTIDIPGTRFKLSGEKYGLPIILTIDYDILRESYVIRLDLMAQFTISPRHQGFII